VQGGVRGHTHNEQKIHARREKKGTGGEQKKIRFTVGKEKEKRIRQNSLR